MKVILSLVVIGLIIFGLVRLFLNKRRRSVQIDEIMTPVSKDSSDQEEEVVDGVQESEDIEDATKSYITNVKIRYNIGGKSGAQTSSIRYRKKNGQYGSLNGRIINAGESFTIDECILQGSITMSGRFQIISYTRCE